MEYCSRQCIRRTFYAVMIGTSPIIICLLLIALVRLILHQIETAYHRRQKMSGRRRSSSVFYQAGRPTLSYTPISTSELRRIIQGQQLTDSSLPIPKAGSSSPKASKFMKSILTRSEQPPPPPASTNTLANLVIRRNAIASTPLTALLAPVSTSITPTHNMINEKKSQRANATNIKQDSIESTTLTTRNNTTNNNNDFFTANDSFDYEQIEMAPLILSSKTTAATTTIIAQEILDFHSAHSVPYSLNLVNSVIENNF